LTHKKKTLLSWSSGKDSAWALHVLRGREGIEIAGLFSTVNERFQRVAMHAVRADLLKLQAESIGLPIRIIPIPCPCSNAAYEDIMGRFVREAGQQKIECMAFGDLFLDDVRDYREQALKDSGIRPIFPLWGEPTRKLAREIVAGGLMAKITCIDPKHLTAEWVGREYDASFLDTLPDTVDPCGENGEFHSFAYDGPMFSTPVAVGMGETVHRDGFVFADLLPQEIYE
jgi:uncharacterized protein (TIGR00290 family)